MRSVNVIRRMGMAEKFSIWLLEMVLLGMNTRVRGQVRMRVERNPMVSTKPSTSPIIVFTDKPFKVGDWVKIGDVEGFVETIGFRSTRIRTWPRTLVFIPNKTISNSQIENFSAMPIRRITFTLRIAYGARAEQIEALVVAICRILSEHPGVYQGFRLVTFTEFCDDGLGVYVYYFTKSTEWKEHMEVRQEVNLAIMRLAASLGLTLGVPERRVRLAPAVEALQKGSGPAGAGGSPGERD